MRAGIDCRKVFADEEAIETSIHDFAQTHCVKGRKVFADEEAIETSRFWQSRRSQHMKGRKVFADEEAIETRTISPLTTGLFTRRKVFADEQAIETMSPGVESA